MLKSNPLKIRRTHCFQSFQNENGVTFIETMVAAGIFSMAITGLSVALVQLGQSRSKVEMVNAAISMNSYITEDIADPSSYPDGATRTAMMAGSKASLTLQVSYPDAKTGAIQNPVFVPNVPLYFSRELIPCAGPSANCPIKAVIDFMSYTVPTTTHFYWKAAYQVSIDPASGVNIGNFGTQTLPFVNPTDFKITLPDLTNRTDDALGCSSATDVAIRGVDRDTGDVTCLKKADPLVECAPGKFPTRFNVIANRLVLDCADGDPSDDVDGRTFTCPDNYALQTVTDSHVYDDRTALTISNTPACVFRGAQTQTAIPVSGDSGSVGVSLNTTSGAYTFTGVTIKTGICPRPAVGGAAYAHNRSCNVVLVNNVAGQCCSIAGCSAPATLIPVAAPGTTPPATTLGTSVDQISCSLPTANVAAWPGACQWPCPAALPAYTEVRLSLGGDATCTFVGTLNQNPTANPP